MSEPEATIAQQLEEARARRIDADLAAAKAELALDLATAKLRAAQAEARAAYAERRLDELEVQLGRRQRLSADRAAGLTRLAPNLDQILQATRDTPGAMRQVREEHLTRAEQERARSLERARDSQRGPA